ncbi:SNARE-binding exocyst subunit S6 [Sticta canariensis]|nr:SNARE-binding exocyst subunit S6 [Sticta canariensis]
MAEVRSVTLQLANLLRHPEDLDKIPFLKSEIIRKKAAVDGQLKIGLKEQLEVTQSGMASIGDGQRAVNQVKEEMMKIDKLCAEAQNMIRDFPNINLVSQVHRNFLQVESMKSNIESFDEKLKDIENLLREDDKDIENQPNVLKVHYELTQLRDIRDDALDQIQRAADTSLEATLQNYFTRLDDVVEWFDDHVGTASMNLIPLVQADNKGMVVRLALIIEEEEKSDKKVTAMQDAQREYKDLASRFKSINSGPKQLRGYKEKFMKAIELYAQAQFDNSAQSFLEEPDKLEKILRWYFNDLYVVKVGMVSLMPKKWKIFKAYTDIYHNLMHDWLIKRIDDPELSPPHMLSIIDWSEKYYVKMAKLGWNQPDLQPEVLDGRESELVSEYRQLIVKSVDEWMDRMFTADRIAFTDRKPDSLVNDEHGYFRTKTLGDMWRMLKEQTLVAGNSGRADVAEGVLDAMFMTLKSRQGMWRKMVDDESLKYMMSSADQEGLQILQDWLIAVANDQIACVDDNEEAGQLGYLTRFQRDFEVLVTPKYIRNASIEVGNLRDGFVDAGTHCITSFVSLIFAVDFRSAISEVFTAKWYTEYGMKRMTTTFDDYVGDYSSVLHYSLRDIFVEELADELLVRYLCCVRNKGAKFRRTDPFTEKFKDDVLTAFDFFQKFPDFPTIKQKWRVVDFLVRMLEADKVGVVAVYEAFKREYWDLQMSWVESVLRSRDDYDRSMLGNVKAKASEVYIERGPETIMSKVK